LAEISGIIFSVDNEICGGNLEILRTVSRIAKRLVLCAREYRRAKASESGIPSFNRAVTNSASDATALSILTVISVARSAERQIQRSLIPDDISIDGRMALKSIGMIEVNFSFAFSVVFVDFEGFFSVFLCFPLEAFANRSLCAESQFLQILAVHREWHIPYRRKLQSPLDIRFAVSAGGMKALMDRFWWRRTAPNPQPAPTVWSLCDSL
jgi:hypothetical protein